MVYYKLRKTTPVNYYGIAKLPSFRNSNTALTAGILTAIDRVPGEVEYSEPTPKIEDTRSHGINIAYSELIGYDQGNLTIPDHPVKSGKWWYYVVGSCTTVSATYKTHTLSEADSQPYLGIHGELEHQTTAYNKLVDLLGVCIDNATLTWSQTRPLMQSFTGTVAKGKSAGNLSRPTTLDFNGNFLPGKFSAVLKYGNTTLNFIILEGSMNVRKKFDYYKNSDTLVTEAELLNRDYEIRVMGLASKNTIFTVPDDPRDYSSNKITLDLKWYRSATSDMIRCSFNNLRLDKPMGVKIDEMEYVWKGNLVLRNCGARTAVSRGKLTMVITDDLTSTEYEG